MRISSFIKTTAKAILFLVACLLAGSEARAQEFTTDTLRLQVYFRQDISRVEPEYRDNGRRLHDFKQELERWLEDPETVVRTIIVRTSASPEGPVNHNKDLSVWRAQSIDRWLTDSLSLDPGLFRYNPVGEDWEGLEKRVRALDVPWRDAALDIIVNTPEWVREGGKIVDSRKSRLMNLEQGEVWNWLDEHVFPDLRAGGGNVSCIIYHRVDPPKPDTVFVQAPPADTVFVPAPVVVPAEQAPKTKTVSYEGRRMIFALRTNFLAIPLTNIGIEVPIGQHWSVGADWYSPWIWRGDVNFPALTHKKDVDTRGWAFQFQAADVEVRYWFKNTKKQPEQRLLGHSIGLYVAAGHYDFERNLTGHQGEFWNVGIDYLYAIPVFKGRMHMEFELGLGFISSMNTPYECLVKGDYLYRIPGGRKRVNWFGPTRAQVSLVWPIYVRTKRATR